MKYTFTLRYCFITIFCLCCISGIRAYNFHHSYEEATVPLAEGSFGMPSSAAALPEGLRAAPSLTKAISLAWQAVAGASGYVIESGPGVDGPFTTLATVDASLTTYRHTGLGYNQRVYYRVKPTGTTEESYSAVISAATHPQDYQFKVLPLGDSNTEGSSRTTNNVEVPLERRAGYRSELYRLLSLTEMSFDFVGHLRSGAELVPDNDHAGISGIRDQDIASMLQNGSYSDYFNNNETKVITEGPYLDVYQPDIILLQVGMNWVDGSPSGMNDLRNILNQVDAYEARSGKEVTVVLSTLLMRVCYTENGNNFCPDKDAYDATISYNTHMKALAAERIASGDRLLFVDMEEAGIDYRYKSPSGGDMADPRHPVQAGYDKMAGVWFEALRQEMQLEYTPVDAVVVPSLAGSLTIRWSGGSPNVQNYIVETATSANGNFMSLASVPGSRKSYRHTGLAPGQTMFYRIRSFDGEEYSAYSQVVSGTTRSADYVYKIMPLGDSNTEGSQTTTDNRSVPVEQRASYRSELYRFLSAADIRVDYVGSRKSGINLVPDDDHAGFPGLRDQDIANILRYGYYFDNSNAKVIVSNGPYLDIYNPDIILLHIGTNSVDGSPSGMNDLIDILDQVDAYEARSGREVTVVLSKLIMRVCYSEGGTTFCPDRNAYEATISYNNNMGPMVANRIANDDRLVLVDMADANLDYRYASTSGGDMGDPIHPTQAGYDKMAGVWFNALSTELMASTLPVELISFKAAVTKEGVNLEWKTGSEQDNDYFVVQRMQEGGKFQDVAKVQGSGTSSVARTYRYTDRLAPGGVLYYRLRQVDLDGGFAYSKVVVAYNPLAQELADVIYPNPTDGREISMQVYGFSREEKVDVLLLDSLGHKVRLASLKADGAGTLQTKLDFGPDLIPGLYFLHLTGSAKTKNLKFVVR